MLKDSLGGDCKTLMIANISPWQTSVVLIAVATRPSRFWRSERRSSTGRSVRTARRSQPTTACPRKASDDGARAARGPITLGPAGSPNIGSANTVASRCRPWACQLRARFAGAPAVPSYTILTRGEYTSGKSVKIAMRRCRALVWRSEPSFAGAFPALEGTILAPGVRSNLA